VRILVVEDEAKISQFVVQTIKGMGHATDAALSGQEARDLFTQFEYDLIILDIMLSDDNGLHLCQDFKKIKSKTPIMLLTALSQIQDKVTGLDAGADDYMVKPFSVDELSARVRALLRRNADKTLVLKCADLELDIVRRQAVRAGVLIKLTTKEYALLEYFLRNVGRPLTRAQIAEHVWDLHFDPESNVVDVYVKHLRKKIDLPNSKKLIKTIVGQGYVLNEE
jgi:two-component system, OmpR family, copper resistance phosphate regulon response regulator CusR